MFVFLFNELNLNQILFILIFDFFFLPSVKDATLQKKVYRRVKMLRLHHHHRPPLLPVHLNVISDKDCYHVAAYIYLHKTNKIPVSEKKKRHA